VRAVVKPSLLQLAAAAATNCAPSIVAVAFLLVIFVVVKLGVVRTKLVQNAGDVAKAERHIGV
jgi:hypothetical protein